MSKLAIFLKNIFLLVALLAAVYIVANYTGTVQSIAMQFLNVPGSSVAGASTKRAQDITDKLTSDVSVQLGILQGKVLNLKVSDAITEFNRLQKIPKDFHNLQNYTKEQIDNMVKSKK